MKTEETIRMEKAILKATRKQGVFGAFEVTIGWFGKERVDYMTYDTKGAFRCYEIKVSMADFHSKAHNTFVGNYNYYVMPHALFEEVKNEIPEEIGVYTVGANPYNLNIEGKEPAAISMVRATKRETHVDPEILKDSLIRCLYRDADKYHRNKEKPEADRLRRELEKTRRELKKTSNKYYELLWSVRANKAIPVGSNIIEPATSSIE